MTERCGDAVGCVIGLRWMLQTQHLLDHVLYLLLRGAACTADRVLDLCGRILVDAHVTQRGREQDRPARMPEHERCADVPAVEHALDGNGVDRMSLEHVYNTVVEVAQTLRERIGGCGSDDPALDKRDGAAAPAGDDAVARRAGARVDAEDDRSEERRVGKEWSAWGGG